tara:strand:+ start:795 stop:1670 length:876 start_codon:yes stop_codon:yes gene_type:complete
MYHYIRDFDNKLPYFNFLPKEKFIGQLNKFGQSAFLKNEKDFGKNDKEIVLTFDDGIKDHVEVAEELKKKNIVGIFFIPTSPLIKDDLLDVHKSHLITGKINGKEALDALKNYFNKNGIKNPYNSKEKEKFKKKYSNQKDDTEKKEFKKIINYYGNINLKTNALNFLLEKFDIKVKAKDFYMSSEEIKYISDMGMIIGSHSVNHDLLSRLDNKEQNKELKDSKKLIEDITKKKCNFFCFPYGGIDSYNNHSLQILNELGYRYSFTVSSKSFSKDDLIKYPYEIPRYDCNEF